MNATSAARRGWFWLAGVLAVVLASLLLRSTFTKKDTTLSNQAIIEAVQRNDWDAISAVPPAPLQLADDLLQVMPQLGDEGSQIAATLAARYPGPHTAQFMLTMAASTHLQAAATAASSISELQTPPSFAEIVATVKRAASPLVRAELYLALGKNRDAETLPALQKLLAVEGDPAAKQKGIAAAARLNGADERLAFMERVTHASPANAKLVYDELLYVGDIRFAKGLLPWLDSQEPATRIGSDEGGKVARMCDLAAWTAMRLGVKVPVPSDRLAVYDDATLQATRAALQQLPNP